MCEQALNDPFGGEEDYNYDNGEANGDGSDDPTRAPEIMRRFVKGELGGVRRISAQVKNPITVNPDA